MALLVFFAFAMQCTSTLAMVRRETNSWKWPVVQFLYMTTWAFLSAFVVNQVLSAFN
jgi:ferrous iron transport protein B